ncbi:MAG: cytochrome c oxidase subunit II [Synechococcus sp.]
MGQIPISLITLVLGMLVTLASVWIGQHNGLLPEQASIQAPLVDNFFNTMIGIAFALFLLVQGAIILFAIQYRQREGDDSDGLPVEGNVSLEAFWTLIPTVIVMGLGIYSVDIFAQMGGFVPAQPAVEIAETPQEYSLELASSSLEGEGTDSLLENKLPTFGYGGNPAETDLTVDVTGLQYAWLFNYPGYDILAGELHVPVNQTVQLNLQAQDVIHSFWVPQFRLKQDAIPGQPTQLNFTANRIGSYPVVCAELCGAYHGGMRTEVVVESAEDFAAWLEENQMVAQQRQDNALAFQSPGVSSISGSTFADEHVHHMGLHHQLEPQTS